MTRKKTVSYRSWLFHEPATMAFQSSCTVEHQDQHLGAWIKLSWIWSFILWTSYGSNKSTTLHDGFPVQWKCAELVFVCTCRFQHINMNGHTQVTFACSLSGLLKFGEGSSNHWKSGGHESRPTDFLCCSFLCFFLLFHSVLCSLSSHVCSWIETIQTALNEEKNYKQEWKRSCRAAS